MSVLATCRRCPRPASGRWKLCHTCYVWLWRHNRLTEYAPPPLPPAPRLTTRAIPPPVRQLIRACVAQGHAQVVVARHFGVSRHVVSNIWLKEQPQ